MVVGTRIRVNITREPSAPPVVAHTCSRELELSSRIADESAFTAGMMAIIHDKNFTIV